MDNQFVIMALDFYSNIYDRIETIPVRWDKKKRRFETISNHRKLIPWYCTMSVEFFTGVGCFNIFSKRILSKQYHVPWYKASMLGFVGFMDALGCIFGWFVLTGRRDGVWAWDNLKVIEQLLDSESDKTATKKRRKVSPKIKGIMDYWLVLSMLCMIFAPIGMLFGALFVVLLTLDPYYYFFKEFLLTFLINHWFICGIIRFLLTLVGLFAFFRLLFLIMLIANPLICMLHKKTVQKFLTAKMNTGLLLKIYGSTRVLLGTMEPFINPFLTVAIFMLQIVGIGGMFSTIAMHPPLIPIPIYFFCPCLVVAAFLIFYVLFTPLCHSYEQFQNFLREMERKPLEVSSKKARKVVSRQVKSLRIISGNTGLFDYRFFPFKKSTKGTFLDHMITFTITLLMRPKTAYDKYVVIT